MTKTGKWVFWIVVSSILFSVGWLIKDMYNPIVGRSIMSLGWLLGGGLLIFFAINHIKK